MAEQPPWQIIADEIDLPAGTASWVLLAHLFTLLSPITVIWSVHVYWDYLQAVMYAPELLYVSAGIMMVASAFEIAQNTFDRWYLTEQSPAFCDWLFASLIAFSMATNITALVGGDWWVIAIAYGLAIAFTLFYLFGGPINVPRSVLGVLSAASMYYVLGDPLVFLPFVSIYLTIVFLETLLTTHAQSMHGFLTGVHGLGLLCTPVAISNASRGEAVEWMTVIAAFSLIVIITVLVKPRLMRLKATPRKLAH